MQTLNAPTDQGAVHLGGVRDASDLGPSVAEWAAGVDGDADAAIELARRVGGLLAAPGAGRTTERWSVLATLAAIDLTAARVAEAHLDALAILDEAGVDPERDLAAVDAGPGSTWGVFAAEGPGLRVQATRSGQDGWRLDGTKPWCSLAGRLTHALVTAHTPGEHRRLFAVDLRDRRVRTTDEGWFSRGLTAVPSGPIVLTDAPAIPIGADGWYLERPGFAWGGAGVAACWYGGAVGVARLLWERCVQRPADQITQMHLGAVDLALTGARLALLDAARAIDRGEADGVAGVVVAARTRGLVAGAAEQTIRRVGHALGPAPLTQNEHHARRVADLEIYVRQHHAERDEAALGGHLAAGVRPW
ncbi:Acyl-CoA dehydrogenase [Nakamurella panacisegetis]|uniref:Acyl-CoA dehydrogenase n=1 Tax=Nakamurella panacisegetis TaxID=1090615 RepID=A0A1H0STR0_9ACTN|nr:acyl-CoA dehydrogenase family protein [Nakamurella panacisegetis]SDP45121.1 Acyl-CoA dehydrogenase [Nakamurella panacisegetis]